MIVELPVCKKCRYFQSDCSGVVVGSIYSLRNECVDERTKVRK